MDYAVRVRKLTKSYQIGDDEVEVLHGIDLDIKSNEFVSIMGPSGSGKSTLLNMVGLLDKPTRGRIQVAGRNAADLDANEQALVRRDAIGFVFQSFNLMPRMTALQNVMLPMAIAGIPKKQRRQRAEELLKKLGLGDRMGNRPNAMSGGQKQRVAIARALALNPPIILADEPTGNLDSKTSEEIMLLFRDLHREGRTIIQVTHSDQMAAYGTRIIRFRDGDIVGRVNLGDYDDVNVPDSGYQKDRSRGAARSLGSMRRGKGKVEPTRFEHDGPRKFRRVP